jgi:hypothetical protein
LVEASRIIGPLPSASVGVSETGLLRQADEQEPSHPADEWARVGYITNAEPPID